MNYYDNVKDTVKGKDSSNSDASFDTLKEEAGKTDVEADEEKGDDTPIEVLEDGGLREQKTNSSSKNRSSSKSSKKSGSSSNPFNGNSSGSESSTDISSLEQRLDRIIEQNERMIEILESFAE